MICGPTHRSTQSRGKGRGPVSSALEVTLVMARIMMLLLAAALAGAAHGAEEFTGFWKGNCSDAFGLQIKPVSEGLYSVSFCGPGGCFEPGTYRPNTSIRQDPMYEVVSSTEILVKRRDGTTGRYLKCATETNPVLRY